jgi:ABC-type transport system substrate-binding protein
MNYKKKDVVIGVVAIVITAFGVVNIILGLPGAGIRGPISRTLVVGLSSPPQVLDPVNSWDSTSNFVIEQVVETLFTYNLSDHGLPRVPHLAESYWWENATTLHIQLKQGIVFQDLTPFNANATKWNLDRMLFFFNCTGTLPSTMAVGAPAFLYYFSDAVTPIINSVVSDYAYNITIYLNNAFAPFLDLLCYPAGAMLSPTSTPVNDYIDLTYGRIVGTGPFIYEYYVPDVEIELGRFESYWKEPAFFETVIMTIIFNVFDLNEAMLDHRIDWLTRVRTDLFPNFETDPTIHYEKFTETYGLSDLCYSYLGMNNEIINVTWRKAISYAINYTYIIEVLQNNFQIRANSPISPGYGAFFNESNSAADFDLITARQTLVDAGIAVGYPINSNSNDTYWLSNPLVSFNYTHPISGGIYEGIEAVLNTWLSAIGIQVVADEVSMSAFLRKLFSDQEELGLFWMSWAPNFKDPFNMLDPLFNPVSSANSAQVNDTKLNTMMTLALETTDDTTRNRIYKNIQWYLANRLYPHCFGYHGKLYYVHSADLRGVPYNALDKFYAYSIYKL